MRVRIPHTPDFHYPLIKFTIQGISNKEHWNDAMMLEKLNCDDVGSGEM